MVHAKQKPNLGDGPQAKIEQMLLYLTSRFDKMKDVFLSHLPSLSQEVTQMQALLNLDFKSSPLSLKFDGRSLD